MLIVGYFDCPDCAGERLYIRYEPPWDHNLAECSECAHSWGYYEDHTVGVVDGVAKRTVVIKPALSPEVLHAGIHKYQQREKERLLRRHEMSDPRAQTQLRRLQMTRSDREAQAAEHAEALADAQERAKIVAWTSRSGQKVYDR